MPYRETYRTEPIVIAIAAIAEVGEMHDLDGWWHQFMSALLSKELRSS